MSFGISPFSFTKCTQYEVYVSATNGQWGSAVVVGTWANNSAEKTASFAPIQGAFLRIRYLNPYCFAARTVTIYIDKVPVTTATVGDNLSNWDPSMSLQSANELNTTPGAREWLGEYHLVAICETALSVPQVAQNFAAGP